MRNIKNTLCVFVLFILAINLYGCAFNSSDETGYTQNSESIAELKNTYWKLLTIQGESVVSIEGERELFLQMRADSLSLKGFAGCNAIMGGYAVEANMLTFSKVASTRKYCASAMDQEQAYIETLASVVSFKIKGEQLFLYDQNEQVLLELESVYLK